MNREKETSLVVVLERLLVVPDHWVAFTDRYLDTLDDVVAGNAAKAPSRRRAPEQGRERRTDNLAGWHLALLDRLFGGHAEDRLDRLAVHPALGGPDLAYFRAQLSRRRVTCPQPWCRLVGDALSQRPGRTTSPWRKRCRIGAEFLLGQRSVIAPFWRVRAG